MTKSYRIAEQNIVITSLHDEVHRLCAAYRVPDTFSSAGCTSDGGIPDACTADSYSPDVCIPDLEADFVVRTVQADIDFEREKSAREDEAEGIPVRHFSDGYLETLAVYRKIAERIPDYNTFLFHGSCVAVDGIGYLFTARSGTGKSTHTRLWRELLGERAVMINDDKPLIRLEDGGAVIYGTPWDGKHRLSTNSSVPLKGICILERAKENAIRPVTAGEAYPMLLQQVYRPLDGAAMQKTLSLVDRLVSCVDLWRLGCNMDIEAARTAYEAMSTA